MFAVGCRERHAIARDQRPAREIHHVEDLPGSRSAGAAIGAHAAAAAVLRDDEVGAVVGAQHDARLQRVHERPLGFREFAQPVLEERRAGAEVDADLGVERPPGGAGELRVRDRLQEIFGAIVRWVEEERVARRHRLLHVRGPAVRAQRADHVLLHGERVPVGAPRLVQHRHVEPEARDERGVGRGAGGVAARFRAADDPRRIDGLDRLVDAHDVRFAHEPAILHVALVLDVDQHVLVGTHRRGDVGEADAGVRGRQAGDVLVRERHVHDQPFLLRLVENRQELRHLGGAQRAVAVQDLRACVEQRPDAEAVEAERLHQVQIGDHVRGAHAPEVGHERQELRRAVDREAIALDAELLRARVRRAPEHAREHDGGGGQPARSAESVGSGDDPRGHVSRITFWSASSCTLRACRSRTSRC